jgi:hypothetical protein
MVTVPLPRLLTVEDWLLTEDPPGGRYEILDGALVKSPSASSVHNRSAGDLADLLRAALRIAGDDQAVTVGVEWRVVIGRPGPRGTAARCGHRLGRPRHRAPRWARPSLVERAKSQAAAAADARAQAEAATAGASVARSRAEAAERRAAALEAQLRRPGVEPDDTTG